MGKNYPVYDKKKGMKHYNVGEIVKLKMKNGYRYAKIEMKSMKRKGSKGKKQEPFKGMTFIPKPKNA